MLGESGTGGWVKPTKDGDSAFYSVGPNSGFVNLSERNRRQDWIAAGEGKSTPEAYINNRFIDDLDLNPAVYLKSVYRNVPGGVDAAIESANNERRKEGSLPYNLKSLDRKVATLWNSNLHESTPGVYSQKEDAIAFASGLARPYRAAVARHELDHAINSGDTKLHGTFYDPAQRTGFSASVADQNEAVLRAEKSGTRVYPRKYATTTVPAMPQIDAYYSQTGEANAEFLAPIKHWAAERGMLIRTEEDGRRAFEQYMKETGADKSPVGPGENLEDRRPAILRRLYRKKAWKMLPLIVQNDETSVDRNEV